MKQRSNAEVSRRAFLSTAAVATGTAAVVADSDAGEAAQKEEDAVMPKCSYWMHGFGGEDPTATAKAMKEAGFNIVVAGGAETIGAVREAGMKSWLCGGAFGLGGLKDADAHKARDINGDPQVWFGSGSPNAPAIREKSLRSYEGMVKTEGIEGILVDGCRFASPASGLHPFFTDFSEHSAKKAAELGFNFEGMKKDVRALYELVSGLGKGSAQSMAWLKNPVGVMEWLTGRPGVLDWFRFRRTCSTEHFRDLSDIIHDAGLRMGVYIFTPSFAPAVGQSYVDLSEFVDVFAPMIYRNYPTRPGPACLNWELMIIPEELGLAGTPAEAAAMELILSWTGLAGLVPTRSIEHIRTAVPPETVGHQTAMARAMIPVEKELAPIIYIDDPLMGQTADLVRENGANGINFFVYKDEWARMTAPALQG